jgi:serine/threonine protein kinase
MNAARLKQIEEIYHSAAEKMGEVRDAFVVTECGQDENLRREVISLLSYEEISDSFIDGSPDDIAAEMFAEENQTTLIGKTIGHYDIKRLIGVGGMGEVYLADDTLLNRRVALKLVPPDLARYRGHLNRFKQEAKAASALNHPNILTIHEFGAENDANYIVSEFVDGVTLRQRIIDGSLSGNETLDLAIQVASALGAAHELGIIHRDIKPENIMIRRDGIAKVLDFGLAKLSMPIAADSSTSHEDQTLLKTAPGSIMGTAGYMSPEQARGVKVDGRTDIWSLGVVLYEMVTGHRPFGGETQTDVIVAILNEPTPPLGDRVIDAPPELQRIVKKALAKNVEERYQTITALVMDLKDLKGRLEFEVELQRIHGDRQSVGLSKTLAPEAVTQMLTASSPPVLSKPSEAMDSRNRYLNRRRLLVSAAMIAVIAAFVLVGLLLSRSSNLAGLFPASPPGEHSIAADPTTNKPSRVLTYSLTVQSYTDGRYDDPFRLSGEMLFRNRDRVRLNVSSPQAGYLYILNRGPQNNGVESALNILFPSPMTNDGTALLAAGQNIQIPQQSWFELDNSEGTELVWVVWSEKPIPELESAKRFANAEDRGRIKDPDVSRSIDTLLRNHQTEMANIERDDDKKETVITGNTDIVAHIIKLEHH